MSVHVGCLLEVISRGWFSFDIRLGDRLVGWLWLRLGVGGFLGCLSHEWLRLVTP